MFRAFRLGLAGPRPSGGPRAARSENAARPTRTGGFGGDHTIGPATRGRVGSRSESRGGARGAEAVVAEARRRSAFATPIPSHHAAESPEAPEEALPKESSFAGRFGGAEPVSPAASARQTGGFGFGSAHLTTPRAPLDRGRVRSIATLRSSSRRQVAVEDTPDAERMRRRLFLVAEASVAKDSAFAATAPKGFVHHASGSDSSEDDAASRVFGSGGVRPRGTLGFFHEPEGTRRGFLTPAGFSRPEPPSGCRRAAGPRDANVS